MLPPRERHIIPLLSPMEEIAFFRALEEECPLLFHAIQSRKAEIAKTHGARLPAFTLLKVVAEAEGITPPQGHEQVALSLFRMEQELRSKLH